jgi:hypothetical protein
MNMQDDMPSICLICLEEGADTLPPCNRGSIPLFHKQCLDMAEYHRSANNNNNNNNNIDVKCPHCNQLITKIKPNATAATTMLLLKNTSTHKFQSIMERWLQDQGYWAKGPEYIQVVHNYLMNQNEANAVFDAVHREIFKQFSRLSSFSASSSQYCSHPPPPDQDAIIFRHRDQENGIETDVTLRRTAIINNEHGSISADGFTVSMSRSRYSKRTFRNPVFIEKRC